LQQHPRHHQRAGDRGARRIGRGEVLAVDLVIRQNQIRIGQVASGLYDVAEATAGCLETPAEVGEYLMSLLVERIADEVVLVIEGNLACDRDQLA
jgi:hypothetical protein